MAWLSTFRLIFHTDDIVALSVRDSTGRFHAVVHVILETSTSILSEEQISSTLEMPMISGDCQTVEMLERLQSRVLNTDEEDSEIAVAVCDDLEDLGTRNIMSQLKLRGRRDL